MKLSILDKNILKNVAVLDSLTLTLTPDDDLAHLVENLRNVDRRRVAKRLLVDQYGIMLPCGIRKSVL